MDESRYTLSDHGWLCSDCGCAVVYTAVHDRWHENLAGQSAPHPEGGANE